MKHTYNLRIIAALVLFIPFAQTHAAPDTQLIKAIGQKAVYWVIDGSRHPFPLQSIYRSHFGNSFAGVTEVTLSTLATYPLRSNVRFKKGSLIKIQTDPKVYEITDDTGSIRWIKSEQQFLQRGFSFNMIQDVPDTFFVDYHIADTVEPPPAPTPILPPPTNNFTTPTSTTSTSPTTTTTVVIPPPAKLSLQNLLIAQKKAADGSARARFTFGASLPARAQIDVGYSGGTTNTVSLVRGTAFEKEITVSSGADYAYLVTLTDDDTGSVVTSTGSFMSYADITAVVHPTAVTAGGPLLKPLVTVGGFTVTNNSSEKRYLISMVLGFFSATNVTTNVNKTLSVYHYSSAGLGDLLAQKNIANGTSILNAQNQQTLAFEDAIAPGESKSYAVTLSNLDNVNLSLINGTETFETRLVKLDALGETSIGITSKPLGSLVHKKP